MRHVTRRAGVVVVVATVVAAFLADLGAASAGQAVPVIRIESTESPAVFSNACVQPIEKTLTSGAVVLSRAGATDEALSVGYEVVGPVEPTSGTVVFEPGSSAASIEIIPTGSNEMIDITLLDAESYDLGDPSSATIAIAWSTPVCVDPSTTLGPTVPELPRTGAHGAAGPLSRVAVGLVSIGTLVLVAARRRREVES